MAKVENIIMNGTVTDLLPNALFKIELENGEPILGHLAGKIRIHDVKIIKGDKVRVEISPYDVSKCRIVWRERT